MPAVPRKVPPRKAPAGAAVRRLGVTLLELALALSLTGVLIAVFVPTFVRKLEASKLSEATRLLETMHRAAASHYSREQRVGAQWLRRCLPESAGPYPEAPSSEPRPVDFQADERGRATWKALGMSAASLRYSYEVSVPLPGCMTRPANSAAITFRAHGDLDGDGMQSLLERQAAPTRDGLELAPLGPLRMISRTE